VKVQSAPKVVAGADGSAIVTISVDGQLVRAETDKDGMLQPKRDASGKLDVVGTDSDAISTSQVAGTPQQKSSGDDSVVVINEGGEAVPVALQSDGTHVRLELGKTGKLQPARDENGRKIKMRMGAGSLLVQKKLRTITEEHDEREEREADGSSSPVQPRRTSMLSPEIAGDARLAMELQKKLELLQAGMTEGMIQGGGGDAVVKEQLKADLKDRKARAEKKRLRRLQKAAENADDDGILEGIYDNLNQEVRAKSEKLAKAKELLQAARQETRDLNSEFEQEREMMLDDLRKQNQMVKFQQAVIDRIVPLIRRDCNYFNIDKIRQVAKWDDERQDWLMPKVTTSGASGSNQPRQPQNYPNTVGRRLRVVVRRWLFS
jgi:hypothetical protein